MEKRLGGRPCVYKYTRLAPSSCSNIAVGFFLTRLGSSFTTFFLPLLFCSRRGQPVSWRLDNTESSDQTMPSITPARHCTSHLPTELNITEVRFLPRVGDISHNLGPHSSLRGYHGNRDDQQHQITNKRRPPLMGVPIGKSTTQQSNRQTNKVIRSMK